MIRLCNGQFPNYRPPYFTFDGAEIGWDALNDKIDELQEIYLKEE